ncbi:MAG: HupE/UreJ family protein [Paracoccaceae bacterium]
MASLPSLARRAWAASAAILLALSTAAPSQAHEVLPTIGDLSSDADELRLDLSLNLETWLAGIDLAALEDTDAAPAAAAARYDALRALEAAALERAARDGFADIAPLIDLRADGAPVPLTLVEVAVGPVGDVEVVRTSTLSITAPRPEGARTASLRLDPSLGVLVLRQQGVEAPYDGYLPPGQATPEIALGGAGGGVLRALLGQVPVGADRVLPLGPAHALFVLALVLGAPSGRVLAVRLGCFAAGHVPTLALAATGALAVPMGIVGPLIALSVVCVALSAIVADDPGPWAPGAIFAFGLLHGVGLAPGTAEVGASAGASAAGLAGLILGVEIALLSVVAVAAAICWPAARLARAQGASAAAALGYAVAALGALLLAALGPGQAQPAALGAAALMGLAGASCRSARVAGFRATVAVPAAALIAVAGAWLAIAGALGSAVLRG